MDSPLPFITLGNSDEGFVINDEAVEYLNSLEGELAVCVVAGLYRTGKSYLVYAYGVVFLSLTCFSAWLQLNLLTNKLEADSDGKVSKGFEVGSSVQACTKGIWIWGEPIEVEGRNIKVLFMDTEGLGSTERSQNEDLRIFSLSVLLASHFLYNSRGVIDGSAIDDLSLVVNLTKCIHIKSGLSTDQHNCWH
jgi:hypothetical protein